MTSARRCRVATARIQPRTILHQPVPPTVGGLGGAATAPPTERKTSVTDAMNIHHLPQRTRTPKDDVWDSLVAHFGNPRTKTERTMFGRVVKELLEAGATSEETDKACQYVLAQFDNPSVNAVPKWFSVAQNGTQRRSAQQLELDKLREMR